MSELSADSVLNIESTNNPDEKFIIPKSNYSQKNHNAFVNSLVHRFVH